MPPAQDSRNRKTGPTISRERTFEHHAVLRELADPWREPHCGVVWRQVVAPQAIDDEEKDVRPGVRARKELAILITPKQFRLDEIHVDRRHRDVLDHAAGRAQVGVENSCRRAFRPAAHRESVCKKDRGRRSPRAQILGRMSDRQSSRAACSAPVRSRRTEGCPRAPGLRSRSSREGGSSRHGAESIRERQEPHRQHAELLKHEIPVEWHHARDQTRLDEDEQGNALMENMRDWTPGTGASQASTAVIRGSLSLCTRNAIPDQTRVSITARAIDSVQAARPLNAIAAKIWRLTTKATATAEMPAISRAPA